MVVALVAEPYFKNPLVSKINEIKAANGNTIPKDTIPEIPYKPIKPGLIMNVAALVIEAAKESPTTQGENPMLPIA